MAPCHRIESERGSAVGTAIGDRVCAGYLFNASAQQPARARKQGGDAHREAVKSLAIAVNAAGVRQAFPIIDIGTVVRGPGNRRNKATHNSPTASNISKAMGCLSRAKRKSRR